jgi:hypothetical protein
MVQVQENLTRLEGRITGRAAHPDLPGYDEVQVEIESAEPVAGTAQLLRPEPGETIRLAVRRELLDEAPESARVRLRAALTSRGEAMAEPHPEAEDFAIL